MESMGILESSHMMSLLIYLKEMGPTTKMDVYQYISRGPNMCNKLDTLESMGIIRMEKLGKTTISLTGKGETIADHLKAVMDLII